MKIKNKDTLWILIAVLVIAVDAITKFIVGKYLLFEQPVKVLPFFNLYFTYNRGAAFSFLDSASGWQQWLFGVVAIGISIIVVRWLLKLKKSQIWLSVSLALILGGALGNLYDRIVYHYVIDFLDFYYQAWHWPAFNIADSAICVGAIMLVIDVLWKKDKIL